MDLRFFRSTMMSLLDTLASMAGGGQQGGSASLLPALIEQLNKYPGGLTGLIASFQKGGLSEIVASWVGTGQNMPVSADQLGSVLDPGVVNELAAKTGQDTDSVLGSLSSLLPQLVDKATPNGEVQGEQQFNPADLLASLSGIFGNRAG
ncbi:YidB family protein [Achromobacter aegrifaciens]|uniref:YidB family protein n=1 Tax=unclassified Achromobacter TaxID=2626865 RepID=UPI001CE0B7E7